MCLKIKYYSVLDSILVLVNSPTWNQPKNEPKNEPGFKTENVIVNTINTLYIQYEVKLGTSWNNLGHSVFQSMTNLDHILFLDIFTKWVGMNYVIEIMVDIFNFVIYMWI